MYHCGLQHACMYTYSNPAVVLGDECDNYEYFCRSVCVEQVVLRMLTLVPTDFLFCSFQSDYK